jgi:hypothetical protein
MMSLSRSRCAATRSPACCHPFLYWLALHDILLSLSPASQVTGWFIVAVAAVGGALAMTGGLLGPPAGETSGGAAGGGGGASGSTGLGIGCLGIVLAAQVGCSVYWMAVTYVAPAKHTVIAWTPGPSCSDVRRMMTVRHYCSARSSWLTYCTCCLTVCARPNIRRASM